MLLILLKLHTQAIWPLKTINEVCLCNCLLVIVEVNTKECTQIRYKYCEFVHFMAFRLCPSGLHKALFGDYPVFVQQLDWQVLFAMGFLRGVSKPLSLGCFIYLFNLI